MQLRLKKCCLLMFLACSAGLSVRPLETTAQGIPLADQPVGLSARYHIETGTNTGFLIVKVDVRAGNHIYGLKQTAPLKPSIIVVDSTNSFAVDRNFKSDKQPTVIESDPVFNARVEKFSGTVQFYVPIKVDRTVDPNRLKPEVKYSGQVCSDQGYCVQIENLTTRAQFAGYFQREARNAHPSPKQQK